MKSHYRRTAELAEFAQDLLEAVARKLREAGRTKAPEQRRRARLALQPGPDTPVWNELVRQVGAYLVKRGDKVRLARMLGLSRQRLHQLVVGQTACADAERTLLLLAWLQAKRAGKPWV